MWHICCAVMGASRYHGDLWGFLAMFLIFPHLFKDDMISIHHNLWKKLLNINFNKWTYNQSFPQSISILTPYRPSTYKAHLHTNSKETLNELSLMNLMYVPSWTCMSNNPYRHHTYLGLPWLYSFGKQVKGLVWLGNTGRGGGEGW